MCLTLYRIPRTAADPRLSAIAKIWRACSNVSLLDPWKIAHARRTHPDRLFQLAPEIRNVELDLPNDVWLLVLARSAVPAQPVLRGSTNAGSARLTASGSDWLRRTYALSRANTLHYQADGIRVPDRAVRGVCCDGAPSWVSRVRTSHTIVRHACAPGRRNISPSSMRNSLNSSSSTNRRSIPPLCW